MKKLLSSLCAILFIVYANAQAPAQINYQGIARNPGGNVFPNQSMTLRLRIHDGSAAGPVVYSETRNVTTNSFGLFNVAIGSPGASSVVGSIGAINWNLGGKYLQVELDPNGGSSFTNMGTSQLLSVPYALNAGGAPPIGPAGGDLTGNYPNPTVARIRGVNVNPAAPVLNQVLGFDGTNWTPVSLATHPDNYWRLNGTNIYNANAGNVGIGIINPAEKLDINGNLKTLGFIMPTGAGAGKFLMSDAGGVGSWSSSIAATSIVLPYKDSASSETEHIFHIIQTSTTSSTGALYGVTRSAGFNAMGVGGQVSAASAGAFSAGVRGENLSTTSLGIGVYGSQNGSGWGVYGTTPSGIGVRGASNSLYGVYGSSNTLTGVFGLSNSDAGYRGGVFGYAPGVGGNGTFGYATRPNGFGALGISDSSIGVYGQSNAATYAALANDGIAVKGFASRAGVGIYGNSAEGIAGLYENTNAANESDVLFASTNNITGSQATMHAKVGTSTVTFFGKKAIWGEADNWVGVFGASENSFGTVGAANNGIGVYGASFNGFASMWSTHLGNGYGLLSSSLGGISGRFENTNASNNNTTLEVNSIGQGRAIVARSNFVGFINAGVVDAFTNVVGANAVFGRATRPSGWGIYGLSDSSAGVAGIGFRNGAVGVYGQGWQGQAGQFIIDNTFINNNNNVLEVSTTQGGKGIVVELNNSTHGLDVMQNGNGIGVHSNSTAGFAGLFENTNPANFNSTLEVISNGTGRAIRARSNLPGAVNAGVIDALTTIVGGNAVFGRGTRPDGWGVYGLSDSSAGVAGYGIRPGSTGVLGQSYQGTSARFVIDNSLLNTSNVVEVSNTQSGNGVTIDLNNSAHGLDVMQNGNGIGVYSNSSTGFAGLFENTNAANFNSTLEVISNGTGRAIRARSNLPGAVNAGVIDGFTNIVGGNAIFGRANRPNGWGIVGLSDSSVGTGGVGFRPSSVGIYGQGWQGKAAQFVIDNSFLGNNNNVIEVSTTQGGNAVVVSLDNSANGIQVQQNGNGSAVYASSQDGISGWYENTNAANANNVLFSTTNGMGRSFSGFINNASNPLAAVRGETSGLGYGVAGVGTNNNTTGAGVYGLHNGTLGNGVIGWGTKAQTFGVIGHADSSVGVYGESGLGNAGLFYTYGFNANVPALFAHSNGISNVASFMMENPANTADAVTINRQGAGRSLFVNGSSFANSMNFYDPVHTGKSTVRAEGQQGFAIFGHAGGTFLHGVQRVGLGIYGYADSLGSDFNYGITGYGRGATTENAGVIGYIDGNAKGSNVNAAIYGYDFGGPGPRYAGLFQGDVQITGTLSKGGGTFKIDHPKDPENKYLVHSFVESPDMMNVYNGNIVTDADGKATVKLPDYFEAENIDFKYQLTVIGQFAQAIIGEEISDNHFVIMTDKPNVKVSWQVTGVRNDKWAQKNRVVPEVQKTGVEKGKYLYPELYGQPRESGITFIKSAMPAASNVTSVNKEQPFNNSEQEKVNAQVQQKRRMLQNQAEMIAAKQNASSTAEPIKIETQSDKTRRMSESLDLPEEKIQKSQPVKKEEGVKSNKSRQLSETVAIEEQTPVQEKKKAVTPESTSVQKAKRLSENTSVAEDKSESKQNGVRPVSDSLVKRNSAVNRQTILPASNTVEMKKLMKSDVKVPANQDGKQKQ